jgi:membrane associated rhomboid family serine protease
MRLRYNAPVTLSFALLAAVVLAIDQLTGGTLTKNYFSIGPSLDWGNILQWPRLVLFVVGHANWNHLISNFAFILLLGPILEEKYGSGRLFFMMFVTALVTGLLNVLFLPTGLLGASGIVFMMIILVSFTNIQRGDIPLTFIFVIILYLAREVVNSLHQDNISQFAHILGGIIGSVFGFIRPPERKQITQQNP